MGKAVKKEEPKPEKKAPSKKRGVKGIIRIAGSDVFGEVPLNRALMHVRGIGHTVGNAISRIIAEKLSVPENIEVGDLNESQLNQIDEVLADINTHLPHYLLNRKKDPDDGKDRHVITGDLIFANRQDIEKEKKLYTWKGYRHAYGKKVRGQRTRNTGRHGKAVGVARKAIMDAKKAATATEKKGAAPVKEEKK